MNKFFPVRLRECRVDKDISQQKVADLLACSQPCYHRYETGQRDIPTVSLITLADYYGTSVDYLLGLTDEKNPYPRSE